MRVGWSLSVDCAWAIAARATSSATAGKLVLGHGFGLLALTSSFMGHLLMLDRPIDGDLHAVQPSWGQRLLEWLAIDQRRVRTPARACPSAVYSKRIVLS